MAEGGKDRFSETTSTMKEGGGDRVSETTSTMEEGGEDRFFGTKSSLHVRFSFQVSTILEANAVAEFPRSETMIADYCMITIGGRVKQFEAARAAGAAGAGVAQ